MIEFAYTLKNLLVNSSDVRGQSPAGIPAGVD
jgi:hypothetical protein